MFSQAIYFDGLLPNTKKEVRLGRLQQSANQLVNFKSQHRDDLPARVLINPTRLNDLLATAVSTTGTRAISAPPFLVTTVMEAIFSSQYSPRTSVVPGEADTFCAHAARSGETTVLTSDSDLLVHDLGQNGRVILFKDLEALHVANKGRVVRAHEYHPHDIAIRLGVPNLVKTAYFLNEDHHRGFKEAVRLAKETTTTDPEFLTFEEQYGALPIYSELVINLPDYSNHPVKAILSQLDARVSELVHHFRAGAQEQDELQPSTEHSVDMYLPFYIDDPTKTSSSRAGASIRQMGYSLLQLFDPSIAFVQEYERRGTRVGTTPIAFLSIEDVSTTTNEMTRHINDVALRYSSLSGTSRWRAYAAEMVYLQCLETLKPLPHDAEMTRLIIRPREATLTWTSIHASAQLQSMLFSLRMLRQVVDVALSLANTLQLARVDPSSQVLLDLSELLRFLPGIAELLEGSSECDATEKAKKVVRDQLRRFGGRGRKDEQSSKTKKKRKKTETPKQDKVDAEWKSNNAFAALVD